MAIIGAILGDIAGSQYEFGRPIDLDWKNCKLFTDRCYFTDDTVMTLAAKLAILNNKSFAESYREWGRKYPNAGYGNNFETWLRYIFKNRGGKWKTIIIWTKLNMGTMREVDCFVTDYNYELITDIEKTLIDFRLDDVGDVGIIETDIDVSGSDLAMQLSK